MQKAKIIKTHRVKVYHFGQTLTTISYCSIGSFINIYWSGYVLKFMPPETELAIFHRKDKKIRFIAIGLFSVDIKTTKIYSVNFSRGKTTYRLPGQNLAKSIKPLSFHLKKSIDSTSLKSQNLRIKSIHPNT
jgi:hypothetical protein